MGLFALQKHIAQICASQQDFLPQHLTSMFRNCSTLLQLWNRQIPTAFEVWSCFRAWCPLGSSLAICFFPLLSTGPTNSVGGCRLTVQGLLLAFCNNNLSLRLVLCLPLSRNGLQYILLCAHLSEHLSTSCLNSKLWGPGKFWSLLLCHPMLPHPIYLFI